MSLINEFSVLPYKNIQGIFMLYYKRLTIVKEFQIKFFFDER